MDMLFRKLGHAAVVLGALNWGMVGVFDLNVVERVFGTGTVTTVIYGFMGLAALTYLPRVLRDFHLATD